MNSFLSREEVMSIGFAKVGKDVNISRHCSIYSPGNISIGDHVRIDDFGILSGNICIGNHVHIAAGVYLYGGDSRIELYDFSCLSSKVSVYAITDDYVGGYMTNPTIPSELRHVIKGPVIIEKHVVVGTGSVILPGVHIGEGASTGAMTLINKNLEPWGVFVGIPAKKINTRDKIAIKIAEEKFENYCYQ